jgi:hypothetical protein
MPKYAYIEKKFNKATWEVIDRANEIIIEYQDQGFSLTLRQLFYQFVSRDLLPNTQRSYKRLGGIVSDARRTGMIDWHSIEDRTRSLRQLSHWNHPKDVLESAVNAFALDKWANQPSRPMVFIEKDALIGVIEGECESSDVPYLSCRGYISDSMIWRMAQRVWKNDSEGQDTAIIHLGDFDPSGLDMTRDIEARLRLFAGGTSFWVKRIALNYDQVELFNPPPNFAKITDSRFERYREEYGESSWELDALDPRVISELIRHEVQDLIDPDLWRVTVDQEAQYKEQLTYLIGHWDDLIE